MSVGKYEYEFLHYSIKCSILSLCSELCFCFSLHIFWQCVYISGFRFFKKLPSVLFKYLCTQSLNYFSIFKRGRGRGRKMKKKNQTGKKKAKYKGRREERIHVLGNDKVSMALSWRYWVRSVSLVGYLLSWLRTIQVNADM